MDITQLILDDHHEQRRLFAMLQEIPRDDAHTLTAVWKRLAALLEVHAAAEERLFYPALLKLGRGPGADETPEAETQDAIHDHNEIRDAVQAVAGHPVGSDGWFDAVAKADEANSDHMAEEEREGLKDFRMHASLQVRHDLAVGFAGFEAAHVTGVKAEDQDPQTYIEEHSQGT
jgi:hemerythrin HHE cation binding domain-containing protein